MQPEVQVMMKCIVLPGLRTLNWPSCPCYTLNIIVLRNKMVTDSESVMRQGQARHQDGGSAGEAAEAARESGPSPSQGSKNLCDYSPLRVRPIKPAAQSSCDALKRR